MNTNTSARPARIGRTKAAELIFGTKGQFFTATWTTKKGLRTMNCRLGVSKGVKNSPKAVNTNSLGLITVWDVREKGYKKLNLQTISQVKTGGVTYNVR